MTDTAATTPRTRCNPEGPHRPRRQFWRWATAARAPVVVYIGRGKVTVNGRQRLAATDVATEHGPRPASATTSPPTLRAMNAGRHSRGC
jgi:hypothetical protein